jgi:hypothetical protein
VFCEAGHSGRTVLAARRRLRHRRERVESRARSASATASDLRRDVETSSSRSARRLGQLSGWRQGADVDRGAGHALDGSRSTVASATNVSRRHGSQRSLARARADSKLEIELWRVDYNTVRPHSALDYRTLKAFGDLFAAGCRLRRGRSCSSRSREPSRSQLARNRWIDFGGHIKILLPFCG